MSEGRDSARVIHWLGVAAVDGARVGPFRLARSAEGEQPAFDVYLDGFEEPLLFGASLPDADALTRRFIATIGDWDAKLRVTQRSSLPPRRRSSKRPSKRSSSRPRPRLPRAKLVVLFLGIVVALSGFAYYIGASNPPDTAQPPPIRE